MSKTYKLSCLSLTFLVQSVLAQQLTEKEYEDEYNANWGLKAIKADAAYQKGLSGQGIKIGVVDAGAALNHREFVGSQHSKFEEKDSQHGTHVAGIIAAKKDGQGMHGVAYNSQLFSAGGYYLVPDPAAKIQGLAIVQEKGVRLINNSWGDAFRWGGSNFTLPEISAKHYKEEAENSQVINTAVAAAEKGILQVWGAGNNATPVTGPNCFVPQVGKAVMCIEIPDDADQLLNLNMAVAPPPAKADTPDPEMSEEERAFLALLEAEDARREAEFEAARAAIKAKYAPPVQDETPAVNVADIIKKTKQSRKKAKEAATNPAGAEALLPYFRPELEKYWLVVVATDKNNIITDFSNRCGVASQWCLAAPGEEIYSSTLSDKDNFTYQTMSGTSQAAPMVTGSLALLQERFPWMDITQVREVLLTTATDLGEPGVDAVYGHGLVNLERAIKGPARLRENFYAVLPAHSHDVWENDTDGPGWLIKGGPGDLTLSGHNSPGALIVREGRIVLAGNNYFVRSATVVEPDAHLVVNGMLRSPHVINVKGTLSGSGIIEARTHITGTFAPGNSAGTQYVIAPLTLGASSQTHLDIDGYGTGNGIGQYDRIQVQGEGSQFHLAGAIKPKLRGISGQAGNNFTPAPGDKFAVLEAQGGFTGGFSQLVQPEEGLPPGNRFDLLFHGNRADLRVSSATLPGQTTQQSNALAGAQLLNAMRDQPVAIKPGAYNTWLGQRLDAGTADNKLYGLVGGQIYADVQTLAFQTNERVAEQLSDRLADSDRGPSAPPDHPEPQEQCQNKKSQPQKSCTHQKYNMWLRGLDNKLHQDGQAGQLSTEQRNHGVLLGVEQNQQQMRTGIAFGIIKGNTSYTHARANTDNHLLSLYGRYGLQGSLEQGPWLGGQLLATHMDTETHRALPAPFSDHYQSKAKGISSHIELNGGSTVNIQSWQLIPGLALRHSRIKLNNFQETGGEMALNVAGASAQRNSATASLRVNQVLPVQAELHIEPHLLLSYRHILSQTTPASQSSLHGITIEQESARNKKGQWRLSPGIGIKGKNTITSVSLNQYAGESRGYGATLNFNWQW